jgi:hypothetical protein
MASKLWTVQWKDFFGSLITTELNVDTTYGIADAESIAALNALRALSQAEIVSIHETIPLSIAGLTNPVAANAGSFDRVKDKAALQLKVTSSGRVNQVTVPAPVDGLFLATGAYALQEVIAPGTAPLSTFVAAAVTEPLLVSAEGGAVTYRKGWRVGQPHP